MIPSRRFVVFCIALGAAALALALPAHLALTDIARGEGDLVAEWRMVQVAAAAAALFNVTALLAFIRFLRAARRG